MSNTTTAAKPSPTMQFTSALDLYLLSDEASMIDLIDQIHARQNQLEALLTVATLDDDPVGQMAVAGRQNYLVMCLSAALEIGELTKRLAEMAQEA